MKFLLILLLFGLALAGCEKQTDSDTIALSTPEKKESALPPDQQPLPSTPPPETTQDPGKMSGSAVEALEARKFAMPPPESHKDEMRLPSPPPSTLSNSKPLAHNKSEGWLNSFVTGNASVARDVIGKRSSTPPPAIPTMRPGEFNTEAYDRIVDNPFLAVRQNPLSTFSIDVDTASYANVRRFLQDGQLPPKDAVRIEELLNYFPYRYSPPSGDAPFSVNIEVANAPWVLAHRLVRIGLKGKDLPQGKRPASNLVFLIDVSGSMEPANKLPLLRSALKLLIANLQEQDHVAIVVYAGASGLVLPSTNDRKAMIAAVDKLDAGGSTNAGEGIELAYRIAREKFITGGNNRVILCTDGDFNVGVTSEGDLTRLIEEKAKGKVFLSVLGFGIGNYKDAMVEKLADKGNGNYAYIDTLQEARKVLVEQMGSTLFTIAKDVKVQVEFNPKAVSAYRLIGYENRLLRAEDFKDDKKDAGEIGAGHAVTALYELVPVGQEVTTPGIDPLKYQKPPEPSSSAVQSGELLTVKLRYKKPEGDQSRLIETPVKDGDKPFNTASEDFKFAAAVVSFGMLLRDSEHKGAATFDTVLELANQGRGGDEEGYRGEFIQLVKLAKELDKADEKSGAAP